MGAHLHLDATPIHLTVAIHSGDQSIFKPIDYSYALPGSLSFGVLTLSASIGLSAITRGDASLDCTATVQPTDLTVTVDGTVVPNSGGLTNASCTVKSGFSTRVRVTERLNLSLGGAVPLGDSGLFVSFGGVVLRVGDYAQWDSADTSCLGGRSTGVNVELGGNVGIGNPVIGFFNRNWTYASKDLWKTCPPSPSPTATSTPIPPPPPPTSTPVPSCGYPIGTYGPGPGCPYFSTRGPWYRDGGHAGLIGQQLWTYSKFSSGQDAVALWSPLLNPNSWVDVKAYIPAGTADAKVAYYVTDGDGNTTRVPVDQGTLSNAWVDLGTYWDGLNDQSQVYGITVHLDNDFGYSSSSNVHVGADAVSFRAVKNCPAGCPPPGGPLPTATPAPPPPTSTPSPGSGGGVYGPGFGSFSTTGWWQPNSGNGVSGQALWTYANANGSTQSTATWSPALSANACYHVLAYIPNDAHEVPDAHYQVTDATGVTSVVVNQNTTSGYTSLGYYLSINGRLPVTLTDQGSAGDYGVHVDADAMQYQPVSWIDCTQ